MDIGSFFRFSNIYDSRFICKSSQATNIDDYVI